MTVPATYRDGAFHPVDLPDGTHGEIAVEAPPSRRHEWLDALLNANLDGPTDGSENVNDYLTGERTYEGRTLDGRDVPRDNP